MWKVPSYFLYHLTGMVLKLKIGSFFDNGIYLKSSRFVLFWVTLKSSQWDLRSDIWMLWESVAASLSKLGCPCSCYFEMSRSQFLCLSQEWKATWFVRFPSDWVAERKEPHQLVIRDVKRTVEERTVCSEDPKLQAPLTKENFWLDKISSESSMYKPLWTGNSNVFQRLSLYYMKKIQFWLLWVYLYSLTRAVLRQ